jgi:KaiC/GvpD/RAD55 family RecA-like ATPase
MADIEFDPDDEEFFGDMGSIGSMKFDRILTGTPHNTGSIPRGFTLLAMGNQGAGMDLFAKQFASVSEDPENTLLITTGESQGEILSLFKKYRWPTEIMVRTLGEEYNAEVLSKELKASRHRIEGFTMQEIQKLAQTRFVEVTKHDYLIDMTAQITGLGPYFRASVDSLDFFFNRYDPKRVVAMIRIMQAHAMANRGLLLFTTSSDAIDKTVERELASICDIVMEFDVSMRGSDFDTRLVIRKFRNAPENLAFVTFRVTPEEAITPETVERVA